MKRRKKSIVSRFFGRFFNWYEGSVWWSRERSWLPEQQPQDAREDLTQVELRELIRKSRYFCKNNPLVDRTRDVFKQYTVGVNGIQIVPTSSDPKYNDEIRKEWRLFCQSPDRSSRKSYATLNGEGANAIFSDGNYLIIRTFEEVRAKPGEPGKQPKIQLIEVQRLGTPNGKSNGPNFLDGIELDDKGKPIGYWLADGVDATTYKYRPASEVTHVFDSKRPGQYFGEPLLTPALNRIHDLDDLQILQMRMAKQAARVANVIKNEAGEFTDDDVIRETRTDTTEDSEGNSTEKNRISNYQKAIGGEWIALKPGEDFVQNVSQRPSVTEQWHWEKVESEICATIGLSRLLVFPQSMQGTVVRADLEISAATLRGWSEIIASGWMEVYYWWLDWAVKNKPNLKNPPPDYKNAEYRAPRGPNVDVGWNSDAIIKELDAGIRTIPQTYAELGKDWQPELRTNAIVKAYAKDLAKEFKLEPDDILKRPDALLRTANTPENGLSKVQELKVQMDTYGVGVRAGAITPTPEDEDFFRKKAGLPPLSEAAKAAWQDDENVRRPITLVHDDGTAATPPLTDPSATGEQ